MDYKKTANLIQKELKSFLGKKKAVIGISGGVDSAVIACLCVNAIGKKNIVGIQMPYGKQSTKDGTALIDHLKINEESGIINIKPMADSFIKELYMLDENKLTNGNIRARVRMTTLYAIAGSCNGLVIGTGNRTELCLGYFTKYGDGGCDIEPIGSLYKTEVFELAKYLGVPEQIINKPPSAELWEGQTDEDEIGLTYEEMDGILKGLEPAGIFKDRKALEKKYGKKKVDIVDDRIWASMHKRTMPQSILLIARPKAQTSLVSG